MPTSSISGLASGLDTATIIDQLMQLEAMPQARLKRRQADEKSVLSALQSINTDVSLLGSRAETLAKAATWQTLKATSTNTAVTATASATSSPGSFTVTVDRLAVAHQLGFATAAGLDDVVAAGGVRLTGSDGVPHDISAGSGSLKDLVSAINAADKGVQATAVRVADGSYRLLVQATSTGESSRFTLTNQDGSDLLGGAAVQQGENAQLSMGLGITATSSTNTFTDLVPGVSLTIGANTATGTTSTITVARDSAGVKGQVKALVDQVNAMLTSLDAKTAGASGTTAAGALAGDATARSLRDALAETVFGGGNTSMATYGLQTDRYGKLVFDDAAFDKAYAADPAATAAAFTTGATTAENGFAARVAAVAKSASDSVTGTVTTAIQGRNTSIDRLQDSIDDWDDRLALRRTTLERQYTALETALSTLKSQGDWLSGQLATLPTSSS
ncbi:MAG TPA: flagellar filament capping protein FliD [Nocardioides sp.]|nr:flagellar filament capping protein FliD [Nocardioides sp.]